MVTKAVKAKHDGVTHLAKPVIGPKISRQIRHGPTLPQGIVMRNTKTTGHRLCGSHAMMIGRYQTNSQS